MNDNEDLGLGSKRIAAAEGGKGIRHAFRRKGMGGGRLERTGAFA